MRTRRGGYSGEREGERERERAREREEDRGREKENLDLGSTLNSKWVMQTYIEKGESHKWKEDAM